VLRERVTRLVEQRVGQRLVLVVEAEQPRDVDHPVVHLAPLRPPRHLALEPQEEVVGAADPARPDVDPRAVRQLGAPNRGTERSEGGPGVPVEERPLEVHGHVAILRAIERMF
jgi:hypothetical protein